MEAGPVHQAYIEKWFCFSIVWSLLAAADRPSRKRLDYLMRDIDSTFPAANTIYDYWVDPKVCFFFCCCDCCFCCEYECDCYCLL